jgi:hypothetical protein
MISRPATADPGEPVALTVSLERCTRKPLSLPGWKPTSEGIIAAAERS